MINLATLDFLTDLKANNNRDWFVDHKDRYEQARENIIDFTAAVIKALSKIDPHVQAGIDPKKCVMRIYRDIRFSKDKTPYKGHFGIHNLTDYKGHMGYYIHIEPGQSFVGGGYWMPEGDHLKAIRQEIDYNAADIKAIIDKPAFKRLFGEFRDQEQLKTIPNGYEADNENIGLLKLKNFAAVHSFTNAEIQKKDIVAKIAKVFEEIYPLQIFLNNAIV